MIFNLILVTDGYDISREIALRWTSLDLSDDKSTLVQVMAWCCQATSHYLNQCWPRSLLPYGVIKPQLDESTARRQLKSPQSLPGRSIHLTLVTKWSWSWSWMTYCHLLCAMSISPPILRYNYFKIWPCKSMVKVICVVKGQGHIWPSKFKGQGYGKIQTHWSHLSSIDMFAFRFEAIWPFLAEI